MAFPFPTFTRAEPPVHLVTRLQPCPVLVGVLENLGFRELAAAELYAAGARFAPTLDDKQILLRHGLDELEHFERVTSTYEDVTGVGLFPKVQRRVAEVPLPQSWAEMAVIGLLFDRANTFQLRAYEMSRDPVLTALARRVLFEEQDHLAAGAAALTELCRSKPEMCQEVQAHFEHWLPLSLSTFDERVTRIDRCLDAPHVDPRDTLEATTRYVRSLAATLDACGLRMPRYSSAPPPTIR